MFCSNCKQLVDVDENKTKMMEREITRLFQILEADIIISFLTFSTCISFAKVVYMNPALHFPCVPTIQPFKNIVL